MDDFLPPYAQTQELCVGEPSEPLGLARKAHCRDVSARKSATIARRARIPVNNAPEPFVVRLSLVIGNLLVVGSPPVPIKVGRDTLASKGPCDNAAVREVLWIGVRFAPIGAQP